MTTITEDYVSFETAKLLKDKGFNEECFALFNPSGMLIQSGIRLNNIQVGRVKGSYSAPTLQMAMKWLREVYNIFIDICTLSPLAYTYRVCLISDTTGCLYEDYACEEGERFMSYEEAVEFALDYCLNNIL